jgi:hypothetical protein
MTYPLRRTVLLLAVAGQTAVVPVARLSCDYVRPVTAILQRANSALLTAPRWGHGLDRLGAPAELRAIPYPRSLT